MEVWYASWVQIAGGGNAISFVATAGIRLLTANSRALMRVFVLLLDIASVGVSRGGVNEAQDSKSNCDAHVLAERK